MAPLRADLREFISDHRAYGLPTPDATEPTWNGDLLMVACPWLVTLTVDGQGRNDLLRREPDDREASKG